MPLQNRVTPFVEIVAISQRGLFIGNRGIIHDPANKTLLGNRWTTRAWIICTCEYKARRCKPMVGDSWTELCFLDEAVALAAGHHPCFLCRRWAAERFRATWMSAKKDARPSAKLIDSVLHVERFRRCEKRLHPICYSLTDLSDGAVVVAGGDAYLLRAGFGHRWTSEGYGSPEILHVADHLLTPPSTISALFAGYEPVFHPSIDCCWNKEN